MTNQDTRLRHFGIFSNFNTVSKFINKLRKCLYILISIEKGNEEVKLTSNVHNRPPY